jgi:outer membrane protein
MGVLCLKGALIEWMEGTAQKAHTSAPDAGSRLANPRRSTTHRMNRTFAFVTALAAGMTSAAGVAQTAGTPAPAAAPTAPSTQAAPAAVAPHAVPAKIALIEYEQAAAATNEGQRALQDLQKKYDPKKNQLQALAAEVDSLKKQLQSAPATLTDQERAAKLRAIDVKEKQLQRDGEDAQNSYGADLQASVGAVAKKLGPIVIKYVQDNGYTMLIDNTGQQGGMSVIWTVPGTDISQAVVDAYNASSGVAAPVPSAPSAATHPHASTAPATAPKAAAPKQ